jgi:hypothetical protein
MTRQAPDPILLVAPPPSMGLQGPLGPAQRPAGCRARAVSVAVMCSVALVPSACATTTGTGLAMCCASARIRPLALSGCPGMPACATSTHQQMCVAALVDEACCLSMYRGHQ